MFFKSRKAIFQLICNSRMYDIFVFLIACRSCVDFLTDQGIKSLSQKICSEKLCLDQGIFDQRKSKEYPSQDLTSPGKMIVADLTHTQTSDWQELSDMGLIASMRQSIRLFGFGLSSKLDPGLAQPSFDSYDTIIGSCISILITCAKEVMFSFSFGADSDQGVDSAICCNFP